MSSTNWPPVFTTMTVVTEKKDMKFLSNYKIPKKITPNSNRNSEARKSVLNSASSTVDYETHQTRFSRARMPRCNIRGNDQWHNKRRNLSRRQSFMNPWHKERNASRIQHHTVPLHEKKNTSKRQYDMVPYINKGLRQNTTFREDQHHFISKWLSSNKGVSDELHQLISMVRYSPKAELHQQTTSIEQHQPTTPICASYSLLSNTSQIKLHWKQVGGIKKCSCKFYVLKTKENIDDKDEDNGIMEHLMYRPLIL